MNPITIGRSRSKATHLRILARPVIILSFENFNSWWFKTIFYCLRWNFRKIVYNSFPIRFLLVFIQIQIQLVDVVFRVFHMTLVPMWAQEDWVVFKSLFDWYLFVIFNLVHWILLPISWRHWWARFVNFWQIQLVFLNWLFWLGLRFLLFWFWLFQW